MVVVAANVKALLLRPKHSEFSLTRDPMIV